MLDLNYHEPLMSIRKIPATDMASTGVGPEWIVPDFTYRLFRVRQQRIH